MSEAATALQEGQQAVLRGLPAPETIEVAPGVHLRVTAYRVGLTNASNMGYYPATKFVPGRVYTITAEVRAGDFRYDVESPPKKDGVPLPGFVPTVIRHDDLQVLEVTIEGEGR